DVNDPDQLHRVVDVIDEILHRRPPGRRILLIQIGEPLLEFRAFVLAEIRERVAPATAPPRTPTTAAAFAPRARARLHRCRGVRGGGSRGAGAAGPARAAAAAAAADRGVRGKIELPPQFVERGETLG